ncbi:MAG: SDR family NAD(P)-dependent oxidoreductase [Desulfomonile sp.]|jgi:2-hydroxycyclohexanecarboxyl-CoA dehydrogenase|nr:SDR family NAD(P)-dependent oxidoreductase [Deltaproteobacteria bacterium]
MIFNKATLVCQGQRFLGNVALVTGSGQGIGQATAFRLASEGALVGILDRNEKTATMTAATIRDRGGKALPIAADVADTGAVANCVQKLVSEFGRLDVLVNNAGFDRPGGFLKIGPEDFKAVWRVHLLGAVNCCSACAPLMIEQGDGRIVNVSSIYGKVGAKGESAYSSAKAGLLGLTKSLARELGPRGIRVNAVLPGLTDTPTIRDFMNPKFKDAIIAETPLGRIADPSEIAAAIVFLASDDASFITGCALEVTGGWNL